MWRYTGIGFIIPSNAIIKITQKGYYLHPYLGFIYTLTSDLAENESLPVNIEGIFVNTLIKNSPADKASMHGSTIDQYVTKHIGDIIIIANDLVNYIGQHKLVGDNITLTVTLAARPSLPSCDF